MKIPPRAPVGNIIAYEYLWSSKARSRQDCEKIYPTALILSKRDELGSEMVYALGISHMRPRDGRRALELPRKLSRHIGLDDAPQWLYTDEVNVFVWPGPDVRPAQWISQRAIVGDTCVLGALPVIGSAWFKSILRKATDSIVYG